MALPTYLTPVDPSEPPAPAGHHEPESDRDESGIEWAGIPWVQKISFGLVVGLYVLLLERFIRSVITERTFLSVALSVILFFPSTIFWIEVIERAYSKSPAAGMALSILIGLLLFVLYLYSFQLTLGAN